jgi:ubiquinone/menaquinone biosynthesis C-methylase UbiE
VRAVETEGWTSAAEYYRAEWEIAQKPHDPRHIFPPAIAGRTLDVGCGCGSPPGVLGDDVVGVDIDLAPLHFGKRSGASHRFAVASGEQLPFDAESFDRVMARVSLPYMHVGRALAERARVIRPGGELWLVLHSASITWRELRAARGRQRLTRLYVLVNGTLMHLTGWQMTIAGRRETFQTDRSIARALDRAGFENSRINRDRHYVVTATRRLRS